MKTFNTIMPLQSNWSDIGMVYVFQNFNFWSNIKKDYNYVLF